MAGCGVHLGTLLALRKSERTIAAMTKLKEAQARKSCRGGACIALPLLVLGEQLGKRAMVSLKLSYQTIYILFRKVEDAQSTAIETCLKQLLWLGKTSDTAGQLCRIYTFCLISILSYRPQCDARLTNVQIPTTIAIFEPGYHPRVLAVNFPVACSIMECQGPY